MSATHRSKMSIAGFKGTFTTLTGAANLTPMSGELSTARPNGILTNSLGEPTAPWCAEGLIKMSVDFTVQTANSTDALGMISEPSPLSQVTVANCGTNATINHGRWVVVPDSWRFAFREKETATYKLEIMCSTDVTVNLSTVVT